jgi:ribosomal protein L37AE/L43A
MSDEPESSNWTRATKRTPPQCPHCGELRLIEFHAGVWFCTVCSKSWRPDLTYDEPVA